MKSEVKSIKNVKVEPEVPKKAELEGGWALTMKNLLVWVLGVLNEVEGKCNPVLGALIAISECTKSTPLRITVCFCVCDQRNEGASQSNHEV